MPKIVIRTFYKFVKLPSFRALRAPLQAILEENSIFGTLLLANEGINGTVASSRKSIDIMTTWLDKQPGLDNIDYKESYDEMMPFYRTRVKLKKEIITMGLENIDATKVAGKYVNARDWNNLISCPDVMLIDTRNDYECQIGSFKHAINPKINTFRQFPDYVRKNLETSKHKHRKVAMFCTGGIRCEKSTAYLKEIGFEEVYQLKGGILKYFEEVSEEETMWKGECFVFDNRVSVNHKLEKGRYDQCYACRMPIIEEEKQDERYQQCVSCMYCFDKHTDVQRQRFIERKRQSQLLKERSKVCKIARSGIVKDLVI